MTQFLGFEHPEIGESKVPARVRNGMGLLHMVATYVHWTESKSHVQFLGMNFPEIEYFSMSSKQLHSIPCLRMTDSLK